MKRKPKKPKQYVNYVIENKITGRVYVGWSDNADRRWEVHKRVARGGPEKYPNDFSYVHRAIRKRGAENFTFTVFDILVSEDEAKQGEVFWIAEMKRLGIPLYNLTDGGDGSSGRKLTEEQKAKISARQAARFLVEDSPFLGKHHTEETKKILSENMKQSFQDNPEEWLQIHTGYCKLTKEQCVAIQKQFLEEPVRMKDLAAQYGVGVVAIHDVLHGVYLTLGEDSIITEEKLQQIIDERRQEINDKTFKILSDKQELDIVEAYGKGELARDIAKRYDVSTQTISKVFKKHGVKARHWFSDNPTANQVLTKEKVIEIRAKHATGERTLSKLALEFGVSIGCINHVVNRRTWKDI